SAWRRGQTRRLDGPRRGRAVRRLGAARAQARASNALTSSRTRSATSAFGMRGRSEEHTSELQSPCNLVCRLLLEKKKKKNKNHNFIKIQEITNCTYDKQKSIINTIQSKSQHTQYASNEHISSCCIPTSHQRCYHT